MENLSSRVLLNGCPVSPLKMKTVVDLVRGQKASHALSMLKFHSKKSVAQYLLNLLKAGVASWKEKYSLNQDVNLESLYISSISVSRGTYVKRIRAASRGRVHRIKRPYSHITLVVDRYDIQADSAVKNVDNVKKS